MSKKARQVLTDLLHVVRVVPVDEDRVRHPLALNLTDFEDADQAARAEKAEADYLVTRSTAAPTLRASRSPTARWSRST